jgi:hypothetical protein
MLKLAGCCAAAWLMSLEQPGLQTTTCFVCLGVMQLKDEIMQHPRSTWKAVLPDSSIWWMTHTTGEG